MANESIKNAFKRMWEHISIALNGKQDKLNGQENQIVGFDSNGFVTYHNRIGREGTGAGAETFNSYFDIENSTVTKNTASGNYSHAEGEGTIASDYASHAEGANTVARGAYSHSEGWNTIADGQSSHAEGQGTSSYGNYQHVQGKYNITDGDSIYSHIVGNGESFSNLSNAHTLDWKGNAWFQGDVYIGGAGQPTEDSPNTGAVKLQKEIKGTQGQMVGFDENGNAIPIGIPKFLYIGNTSPADEDGYILWIDTTQKTGGLKYHSDTGWVHVPVAYH